MRAEAARAENRSATVPSGGSFLRSFQASGGFDAALARHVQGRLRTAATFLACAAGVFLATSVLSWRLSGSDGTEPLLTAPRVTLAVGALVSLAIRVWLGRLPRSPAALGVADAAQTGFVVLAATVFYATGFTTGPVLLVPVLGLLLVARAVFVPSPPLRTFLLSVPAAPATLAVVLSWGTLYSLDDEPVSHGSYVAHLLWEQVLLALSIGLATWASHVHFALRRQAFRATELGQYRLVEPLGRGAMGEVWRAQHALLQRATAIKLIRRDVLDERALRRFEQEVRQCCRLTHPNVISIYDFGHTPEGVFFYAMELLDGVDLDRVVRESGPLPPARVIHLLAQACSGLAEAHSLGLVHRDVKAANLFVCERGLEPDVVKIVDFGLVADTSGSPEAEGEVCGTPETLAPETIRGRPPAPSADVYALGAVGCYLLTGRQIFDAERPMEFVTAHLTREPVLPSARREGVPADLEGALAACLRKDPDDRTPSVLALRSQLLACADAGRWTPEEAAAWWRAWRERAAAPSTPAAAGAPAPR